MEKKDCFGILDRVFPHGKGGLREVPPECTRCPDRVSCLRAALKTREGLEMRSGILDRASGDGWIGMLRRWSERKALHRKIAQEKKKGKCR
ncbi:MAG: hypothetical protein JRF57_06745 [Deltaproteobacteria bacterium]|nr:hypothetical protein [Deltaproteobacteria bacterium]